MVVLSKTAKRTMALPGSTPSASFSTTRKAGARVSAVQASVRIRRRADVTPAMRVMIGAVEYDIRAVVPVEDGRTFMDLACEARR